MKISKSKIIFDELPDLTIRNEIQTYSKYIKECIQKITNPESEKIFKINSTPIEKVDKNGRKKNDYHNNGVQPIKKRFSRILLKDQNWKEEQRMKYTLYYKNLEKNPQNRGWGPLDFSIRCKTKLDFDKKVQNESWGPLGTLHPHRDFVVEWETGNVSSSHRSIDKICSTILFSRVIGGILIVPTAEFKKYLTDRVGNYEELEPYFQFWEYQKYNTYFKFGYLEIIGITYDEIDDSIDYLPKGQDGNADKEEVEL